MPIPISKIDLFLQVFNMLYDHQREPAKLSLRHQASFYTLSPDDISHQKSSVNYEWSSYQLPSSLLFDATALMKTYPGRLVTRKHCLDQRSSVFLRGDGELYLQTAETDLAFVSLYLKTEMKAQGPHLFQCNDCAIWRQERFVWSSWYLSPWPFSIPSLAIWQMCQLDYFKRCLNK